MSLFIKKLFSFSLKTILDKIITYLEFYISIFILLVISLKNEKISDKNRILFTKIFFYIFILIFSFRTTGDDYQQYVGIFQEFQPLTVKQMIGVSLFKYDIEFFWVFLISVIKTIGLNHRFFFFIAILIPLYVAKKVIIGKGEKECLFLFFWYIILNFESGTNIVRQFIANNLYLLILYLYSEKKKKKALSLGIVSILFHNSSFIAIPSLEICKKKYSNTIFYYIVISEIIIAFFLSFILKNMSFDYSEFANNRLLFKFFYYVFTYQRIRSSIENPLITIIVNTCLQWIQIILQFLVIFYGLNNKKIREDSFGRIVLNSECLGFVIFILFKIIGMNTIGYRFNSFLSIGQFYLIFQIIISQTKIEKKRFFFILFLLITIIYLIFMLLHNMYLGLPASIFYLNIPGLT